MFLQGLGCYGLGVWNTSKHSIPPCTIVASWIVLIQIYWEACVICNVQPCLVDAASCRDRLAVQAACLVPPVSHGTCETYFYTALIRFVSDGLILMLVISIYFIFIFSRLRPDQILVWRFPWINSLCLHGGPRQRLNCWSSGLCPCPVDLQHSCRSLPVEIGEANGQRQKGEAEMHQQELYIAKFDGIKTVCQAISAEYLLRFTTPVCYGKC